MPSTGELASVLARTAALAVLDEHAQLERCELGVYRTSGEALRADGALSRVRLTGENGTKQAEGAPGLSAVAPIRIFDRVTGYVVALAPPAAGAGAPRRVAEHSATLLGELCSREYELNDLSREILASYEELNLFYDLTVALAGAPDADAICSAVLLKACEMTSAAAGRILLADREGTSLRLVATLGGEAEGDGAVALEAGAAGLVFASLHADIVDDPEQLANEHLDAWERRARESLVTVPVYVPSGEKSAAVGVLQLRDGADGTRRDGSPQPHDPFSAGDLKLAQALASQAALLIQNSRLIGYEREMRIARTIQESLLPAAAPQIEGLEMAGVVEAADKVGGDYYDFVPMSDGRIGLILADVSGHNLAAALMQTAARSTFRAAALDQPSPLAVLDRVNRTLIDDLSRAELFVTAWFACADGASGELIFGDAGHNPALLYRASTGKVLPLEAGGLPLGVAEDGLYQEARIVMEPGDALLAYTDGLTEARSPQSEELYGEHRLEAALEAAGHMSATEIRDALLDDVRGFDGGGPAGDDRTVLVLKRRAIATR